MLGASQLVRRSLEKIYLNVPFAQKDQAKSLGARWDPAQRKWYVSASLELTLFQAWLDPTLLPARAVGDDSALSLATPTLLPEDPSVRRGVPLSQLLNQVSHLVAQAFAAPVWTTVEVINVRAQNGHVYLELSERDAQGRVLAKANGAIWASTAAKILPRFEAMTGATLAPGIKLLLQARPVFKAQYGFSLEVVDIDPEFTLGDLEAKKREIRARLQQEGLFARNKSLSPPWDYRYVLVIAPQGAAGLGDFQAEAARLEAHGVCQFVYGYSRFQGEGAAAEIRAALLQGLADWREAEAPDAVAIIRGGGAVNDLAWLNDYALARSICELDIPVLTGIGHERDSTVLDEVANIRFDTPSKVIAGIERTIKARADDAWEAFTSIVGTVQRVVSSARLSVGQLDATVKNQALRQIAVAREQSAAHLGEIRLRASGTVHEARITAQDALNRVNQDARQQVATARQRAAERHTRIGAYAEQQIAQAKAAVRANFDTMTGLGMVAVRTRREAVIEQYREVRRQARQTVADATNRSESLWREIVGQGTQKTLSRGFAIVRDGAKGTITSAKQASKAPELQIEFHDGRTVAIPKKDGK